ncbi:MAG: HDOD domain-containing protein [Desulfovibrionales bacterium]
MGTRALDDIATGMVLSRDVLDQSGRLLLPKGTTLGAGHIAVLKKHGVGTLEVHERSFRDFEPEVYDRSEAYVKPLFAAVDLGNETMQEIYRLSVRRTARRMAEGWNPPPAIEPELPASTQDQFFSGESTPQELVSREVQLSAFPEIYFRIREELNNPRSTAAHVARIVSRDTSLSAKLLRLVNSSFYGFSGRVESITRAIALIGANELSTLALGISVTNALGDIPEELIDMKEFWNHSIAVGTIARVIAARKGIGDRERFLVEGMLHDVGRLILFKNLPNGSADALNRSRSGFMPLVQTERDVFGFDHALIGSLLLKQWNLPTTLEQTIRFHHSPAIAPVPLDAAIIHFADILAIGLVFAERGSLIVPPFQDKAWEILDLPVESLETIVEQAEEEIESVLAAFFD